MKVNTRFDNWDLRESETSDAKHQVLFLAGALLTAASYQELLDEPILRAASIRVVAATIPGFGRTFAPNRPSIEEYAGLAAKLAADLGCDAIVGHSNGANITLELAAQGLFKGPVLLLSPSFSAKDEPALPRAVNHLASILGYLPWALVLKVIGSAVGEVRVSEEQRKDLVTALKNNDSRFLAPAYRLFIRYLNHHGSVAQRLCGSGVPALVAFAEHDDVGLTDLERQQLENCPTITLRTIPGFGHLMPLEAPNLIAGLIKDTLSGPLL